MTHQVPPTRLSTIARLDRRGLLGTGIAAMALPFLAEPARAQLTVDITRGTLQPIPIAISPFAADGASAAQLSSQITDVVSADLERSGLFDVIDPRAYIQGPDELRATPRFADWRQINAQALVSGTLAAVPAGLQAEFRLWDVLAGSQMTGLQLNGPASEWRQIAHKIADAIYQRITGSPGYFNTRIAYVSETGPRTRRISRIAIMDQDGANHRFLTDGREEVQSPRFTPDGKRLAYLVRRGLQLRAFIRDLNGGPERVLLNTPGMNFAPRFSPDGQTALLTVMDGGDANIVALPIGGGQPRRLTMSDGISTSPSFSPDGARIVFTSDRNGRPSLYVMSSSGEPASRISFGDGQYQSPVWSPRGDLIAFVNIKQGYFHIGVMRPDGSDERLITRSYQDEAPAWAPNGRVIIFQRTDGAGRSRTLHTIDVSGNNERPVPTPLDATDPAWSPLIS